MNEYAHAADFPPENLIPSKTRKDLKSGCSRHYLVPLSLQEGSRMSNL